MEFDTTDTQDEQAVTDGYFTAGERRAARLDNRGPLRFAPDGGIAPDIVEAYLRTGLYVFENVVRAEDLTALQAEFQAMLERLPVDPSSRLDTCGRPAIDADLAGSVVRWTKPLGDPMGGTGKVGGRAPVKMFEPAPARDVPEQVPYLITGPLQFSDAALRIYGHPGLLAVAAAINGEDFAPFNEVFIVKKPGEGGSFAWHQDGLTHWNRPDWTPIIHGFNFMVQLYGCTAENGLWYIPGSHLSGKADIKALVEAAGGNLLPGAVPLICGPGDVAICNRQLVHASFPNTGSDWRVTFNMGFHPLRSVLDVETRGMDGSVTRYDADRLRRRSEMIGYAIDARRQRFDDEVPFVYRPHRDAGLTYVWADAARSAIRDYQRNDMLI